MAAKKKHFCSFRMTDLDLANLELLEDELELSRSEAIIAAISLTTILLMSEEHEQDNCFIQLKDTRKIIKLLKSGLN